MAVPSIIQSLRGSTHFLSPDPAELHQLLPGMERFLPPPPRVFLEDEEATPLRGYPVLFSRAYQELRNSLASYVELEEQAQVAAALRRSFDAKQHSAAWDTYRRLLERALENVTLSSHGRRFPEIFWLLHSHDIARCLKETPRRVRRMGAGGERSLGDSVKYRVFDRYQDRLLSTTYDLVQRLATDTEEVEEELFSRLLRRMLDNVLIFTEDYISHTLDELNSYFTGCLGIDGRDLRRRLEALEQWHGERMKSDPLLGHTVRQLVQPEAGEEPARLLRRSGYVSYLAGLEGYDGERLLGPQQVAVWENLLLKLKEFELYHLLRRHAVLVYRQEDGSMVCTPSSASRPGASGQHMLLSAATRPLDFMAPWVVDPVVQRFGLVYDITDFSALVSVLRLAGPEAQDQSFRAMFSFQRRIHRLADHHRMKLEKYLGDGAFFSSRHPRELLPCAVRLQQIYRQAVGEGFPFNRGLRIALNYSSYRLVPLRTQDVVSEADRYEFFGHGVVELSRLTTGKVSREIDEIKNMLISQGYPEATVHRFFAPMMDRNVELVDKHQEGRQFFAYINRNGHLVNEGIVATGRFVAEVDADVEPFELRRCTVGGQSYLSLEVEEEPGKTLRVGLRQLGIARLKGLDDLAIYEIVGADEAEAVDDTPLPEGRLLEHLDREFAGRRMSSG